LPIVLYGYGTLSIILREEHSLRVQVSQSLLGCDVLENLVASIFS